MKIFLFAASLRQGSYNKKLIRLVTKLLQAQGNECDLAEFNEFTLPIYDGDMEKNEGIPANVHQFIERMHAADAIIISSPEYNHSMPGTLKNLIDWVSRVDPMPWKRQRIYLLSASPSMVGGNRGLWNTRVPLEDCGAFIYPEMFSLAQAHKAFTEDEQLTDAALQKLLGENLLEFLEFAQKLG